MSVLSRRSRSLGLVWPLLVLNCATAPRFAVAASVTQEIRYHCPEAGAVVLVWGLDGWTAPPPRLLPQGTRIANGAAHTPMAKAADRFVARLEVPQGATIDYAFLIAEDRSGADLEVWDANGDPKQDYHTSVDGGGAVDIVAPAAIRSHIPAGAGPPRWIGLWVLLGAATALAGAYCVGRTLGARAPRVLAYVMSDPAKIVMIALATRLFLFGLGYLSHATAANPGAENVGFQAGYAAEELEAFSYADAEWYLGLAKDGYERRPYSALRHANWAFYPLYPLLLRTTALVSTDFAKTGIVLSTLCFLAALVLLYELIALDFGRNVALATAGLAIAFPGAYFCSRAGPEALFFMLSVGAFYAARRDRWLLTGVLGALVTLTRVQGILLLLPLGYLALRRAHARGVLEPRTFALLLIPAASLSFMAFMYRITGNPFASFAIQRIWDNQLAAPFTGLVRFLARPLVVHYYGYDLSAMSAVFAVIAILLTVTMVLRPAIPREYVLYALVSVLVIVARENLSGTVRFLVPVFPLYLITALLLKHRPVLSHVVTAGLLGLQVFYFVNFVHRMPWAAN